MPNWDKVNSWSIPVPNEDEEIRKWNGLIYRFVYRLTASGLDEDVAVSEMQIALLKAIRTYDPNRGMKRISWYYLNLLSASRSMYRNHTKNRISTKSNMKLDCPMDGDYVFGIDDRVCDLAMRDLDAKQHQIIHMRMYKGMSRPEVASALGITLQTVQTTEKRSLRIMRNALKERGINDIYDARHADGSNGEFICKE